MSDVDKPKAWHDRPLDAVEQKAEHVHQVDQSGVVLLDRDDWEADDSDDGTNKREHLQSINLISVLNSALVYSLAIYRKVNPLGICYVPNHLIGPVFPATINQ